MSNGTPQMFEGGPEGPPGLLTILSFVYAALWVLAAIAAVVFRWTALTETTWIVATSIALLVAALAVVGREMGLYGARAKHK